MIGKLYAEGRDKGWLINAYITDDRWRAFARPIDFKSVRGELQYPGGWGSTEEEAVISAIGEIDGINHKMHMDLWRDLGTALQENIDARS
jgi:hypothetical protein